MPKRKIVQIAARDMCIYALDNLGIAWELPNTAPLEWSKLPALPDDLTEQQ